MRRFVRIKHAGHIHSSYGEKANYHGPSVTAIVLFSRDANFRILIWSQILWDPDLGTFIDFQPVLVHFAQMYVLFQIFLAGLIGIIDFPSGLRPSGK